MRMNTQMPKKLASGSWQLSKLLKIRFLIDEACKAEANSQPGYTKLAWPLRLNERGEIVLHRRRILLRFALMALGLLLLFYGLGTSMKPLSFALICGATLPVVFVLLKGTQRKAQGKPYWQFSLRDVLVVTTVIALVLAVNRWERYNEYIDSMREDARRELFAGIPQIIGTGSFRISGTPATISIVAKRPSFSDDDLREILDIIDRLEAADAPITHLQLIDTNLTDRGVALLSELHTLRSCLLDGSNITDEAIDDLQQIDDLDVLSVERTAVSDDRLKQLSIDRPDMSIISSTTYQKPNP